MDSKNIVVQFMSDVGNMDTADDYKKWQHLLQFLAATIESIRRDETRLKMLLVESQRRPYSRRGL